MIPNIIHYCWFGNNPKPQIVQKCLSTWHEMMPDCEIIEWNETNYDVNKSDYIREAYKNKKYAFVSDYARFDILRQYGGIYLDTDVEMVKPIPMIYLEATAFTGMDSTLLVSPGLVFASEAGHPFLNEILDIYNQTRFIIDGKMNLRTVCQYATEDILIRHGYILNGQKQVVDDIVIYPYQYFAGFNTDIREIQIKEETILIHHYTATWVSKRIKLKYAVQMAFKGIIGSNNYKELLKLKRKLISRNV